MQPENTANVEQKPPVEQAQTQQPQAEPPIKSEENKPNWAAFRAARESERKAKEEAERRAAEKAAEADALRAALEAAVSKPSHSHHHQSNEEEESEDVRLQKKVDAAVEVRLQRERQAAKEREIAELPQKIARDFPDFDQVCSSENLDYLDFHYPELSQPFKYMPDGYEKWAAAYKVVKRFIANPDVKKDQAKAEKNAIKPQSLSLPGAAQGQTVIHSNLLTEERKAANWARMRRSMQGLG